MSGLSSDEAIGRARIGLGIAQTVEAQAHRVRHLLRQNDDYYLVIFGEQNYAVAVAIVRINSGEIANSAQLPGRGPHLTVSASQALALAGLNEHAGSQIELVWQPCRASRSPLYPIWKIQTPEGEVYVDQQGNTWQNLNPAGPGG
jgi:hypothetical protein